MSTVQLSRTVLEAANYVRLRDFDDPQRLQSQLESLLEECQIKLSSVVSDLLGASGRRILAAIAAGQTEPVRLKDLGDRRLRATDSELMDALSGEIQPLHRNVLKLYLQRLDLIEAHMANIENMIGEAMKAHGGCRAARTVTRLRR